MENCLSEIQQHFSDTTIFITGGTGFLGKLLVEKLLRTCNDLKRIYILMRHKKDKSPERRLEEFFDGPLYERLKKEQPKSLGKLSMMTGDCELPNLGLSDKDVEKIISEVNCVFHVAATVRFNEKLQKATYINVRATRDMLNIAKKINGLKSFVHVSTAFSFCPRETIDEVFYEPPIKAENLLTVVDAVDEDQLTAMTPILTKEWPNTYVCTKSVAEDLVNREGNGLPIAVVRPSIVVPTTEEPVPGWIDNFYGVSGLFTGIFLGVVRTMHYKPDGVSEQVPADYVINNIIAAAWNAGNNKYYKMPQNGNSISYSNTISNQNVCNPTQSIPIYNYVSSARNPISWKDCHDYGMEHVKLMPSVHMQWQFFFKGTANKTLFIILHYLLHLLPAYILDFLMLLLGKKPMLVKAYKKIEEAMDALGYFATGSWTFKDKNTQALWKKMEIKDKKLFNFDIASHDWDDFSVNFVKGARLYLLKDTPDTIPQAKRKAKMLKIAHYILVISLLYLSLRMCLFLANITVNALF